MLTIIVLTPSLAGVRRTVNVVPRAGVDRHGVEGCSEVVDHRRGTADDERLVIDVDARPDVPSALSSIVRSFAPPRDEIVNGAKRKLLTAWVESPRLNVVVPLAPPTRPGSRS
jgi:hypothetical protein